MYSEEEVVVKGGVMKEEMMMMMMDGGLAPQAQPPWPNPRHPQTREHSRKNYTLNQ
jgi:hypothetical protein